MSVRVEHGDCLTVIPQLVAEGVQADAVVCDPPYGLEFMSVAWDSFKTPKGSNKARDNWGDFGSREHPRDSDGVARVMRNKSAALQKFSEAWAGEAIQILKPGGYLLAFGGTRTSHRMVCGLEDAGFVIQDTIAWMYGTGFPKNKAHLKPAYEPIVLAYKPGGKRTMQIDECRIEGEGNKTFDRFPGERARDQYRTGTTGAASPSDLGRWPANVCHDGSEEVLAAFPDSAGQLYKVGPEHGDRPSVNCYGDYGPRPDCPPRNDSGSAARFFFSAKAGAEDRWGSRHPTVKPIDLIAWLVKLVCPPGGLFLDPFAGSGTAGVAALRTGRDAILIERDPTYIKDIEARMTFCSGEGGHSVAMKARRLQDKPLGGLFQQGTKPDGM